MKSVTIKLSTVQDIRDFVNANIQYKDESNIVNFK